MAEREQTLRDLPDITIVRAFPLPQDAKDGLRDLGIDPNTFFNAGDRLLIPGLNRGMWSFVLGRINGGDGGDGADVAVGGTVYRDRPGTFRLGGISPLHARVEVHPRGVNVVDLQSATGLWLRAGGKTVWVPVTQTGPLRDGDQIMLGQGPDGVQLIFHPTRSESGSPCGGGWSFTRAESKVLSS